MSFWQNVEMEIEYKGISRKELAFRANIAYQGIGLGIERESMPRVDTALKIAKVLEVPLEYLINEKDLEIRPAAESLSKEEKNKRIRTTVLLCIKQKISILNFIEETGK